MRRTVQIVVALATVLSGALVAVAGGAAEAQAVRPPSLTAPTSVREDRPFKIVVNKRGSRAVRVVLERRAGGAWRRVQARTVAPRTQRVTFRRTEQRPGVVKYRATVAGRHSTVRTVRVRRATPPAPVTMLLMSAGSLSGEDTFINESYTVGGDLTRDGVGVPGVRITVEKRLGVTGDWAPAGSYVTDAEGTFSFDDSSAQHGIVYYRGTGGGQLAYASMPVFEVLQMAGVVGNGVSVSRSPGSCNSGIGGSPGAVSLFLRATASPACTPRPNQWVQVSWNPPGVCAPLSLDSLGLESSSSPSATAVRFRIFLDGTEVLPDGELVERGDRTGRYSTASSEFDEISIRMSADAGEGNYEGLISGLQATCA